MFLVLVLKILFVALKSSSIVLALRERKEVLKVRPEEIRKCF